MLNKAVIDLRKIKNNAKKIKQELPKTVKFCAVVKADAYGHGAVEVSNALYTLCDYFAVAITEEGITLRQGGIDKPILVFGKAYKCDVINALYYNLTLTVMTFNDIVRINNLAKKYNKKIYVHIKFNTGMNRCGIDSIDELKRVFNYAVHSKVVITGIYSHYYAPENDKELKRATDKFLLANKVAKSYNNNIISHISASGGFLKGKYFDMVRIGILLYGYKPFPSDKVNVLPCMKVYSNVIKMRNLSRGEHLLYGNKKLKKNCKVALVRYGYADGLNRAKSPCNPINRCMDISAVKTEKNLRRVKILDDAETLAKSQNTISYEVLTKVSLRAEKYYIR